MLVIVINFSVQLFPSGHSFGTASDDGTCRLFDIRADQQVAYYGSNEVTCGKIWLFKLAFIFGYLAASGVAFSKSGRLLFDAREDFNVYIWDTIRQEQVGILDGHTNRVSCIG